MSRDQGLPGKRIRYDGEFKMRSLGGTGTLGMIARTGMARV